MRTLGLAGLAYLVLVVPAQAGLYSADEPFNFEIGPDGVARPIQFAGGFESIIGTLREIAILPKGPDDPPKPARQDVLLRISQRRAKGPTNLTSDELASYTTDLIRLNRPEEALNLLQPLARDPRRGGFLAYAHLARAHAGRGEWREAYDQQLTAIRYSDFPTSFGQLTKPQLAWLQRVERDYYLPFLAHRAAESRRGRPSDLREDVDALFPSAVPPKKADNPVRFVGTSGEFVAGSIADAERKKLPADALAIVQQLVLWHPQDARLYWLLGELYNAEGEIDAAVKIVDHCSFNMGYSNPILLRHRQILQQAATAAANQKASEAEQASQADEAERQRADDERRQREETERDYQKRKWWIIAIAVALGVLLAYHQVRELIRRSRRSRGGMA